jgi:hypothetical protein
MQILFNRLTGSKLKIAEFIHDYIHMQFENESVSNIFNKVTTFNFELKNLSDLKGRTIISIESSENLLSLDLEGKILNVGISEFDYVGPEALDFKGKDGELIVWR